MGLRAAIRLSLSSPSLPSSILAGSPEPPVEKAPHSQRRASNPLACLLSASNPVFPAPHCNRRGQEELQISIGSATEGAYGSVSGPSPRRTQPLHKVPSSAHEGCAAGFHSHSGISSNTPTG